MRVSEILKKCLRNKNFILGSCMVGLMVLIMVVGFFYMPYDPDVMDTEHELQFFSAAHPLGTDQFGRDILSRIMEGTRVSFLVGALTVVFGLLVGGTVGAVAGYYGGKIDEVIMKLIDTQMAFPGVLLALMLIAVFGNSLQNLIFALGIMSIPRLLPVPGRRVYPGGALPGGGGWEDHLPPHFAQHCAGADRHQLFGLCRRRDERGGALLPGPGYPAAHPQLWQDAQRGPGGNPPGRVVCAGARRGHHLAGDGL